MATPDGGRMPLIEHLRELRRRVVKSSIAIMVGFVFGWVLYNPIITKLAEPVCDLKKAQEQGATHCGSLYINGVLGPLNLQIKVALLTGVIVMAPIWLYQLWAFIAPALHRKEKRSSIAFFAAATPFFAAGATLGYIVLPVAIRVLFGFTPNALSNLVKFDDYLDFVLRIILLFGIAFELPVFLVTFNFIGFLSGKAILKPWRIWIFGITLFIAGFTPSADPLSMLLLAVPLISLYFMAGGIALLNDRRRGRKFKESEGGEGEILPAAPIESVAPIDHTDS
ncbi:TatC Sec-independent protein secretion pathway component TatC [Candidatus Nanopelagicaceae bacterium]